MFVFLAPLYLRKIDNHRQFINMLLLLFFTCIVAIVSAEKFLESVECNQNYPLLLLHLMDKDGIQAHIRVSAAITFKNYIKRNWRVVSTHAA